VQIAPGKQVEAHVSFDIENSSPLEFFAGGYYSIQSFFRQKIRRSIYPIFEWRIQAGYYKINNEKWSSALLRPCFNNYMA
jgi:hypothetical protein